MKKIIIMAFVFLFALSMVTGCADDSNQKDAVDESQEDVVDESSAPITFEAVDINGKTVTSDIFSQNKMTVVNLWGTFCPPCIEEMPDLQLLYEELKGKNVNLIGIMVDVSEDQNMELAKNILQSSGAKFTNIIPDKNLYDQLISQIAGVPTTFFIDQQGNIVGEPLVGARSKEDYMKDIDNVLKNLE